MCILCVLSAQIYKKKLSSKDKIVEFVEKTCAFYSVSVNLPNMEQLPKTILNQYLYLNGLSRHESVKINDKIYLLKQLTLHKGGIEPSIFGPVFWKLMHDVSKKTYLPKDDVLKWYLLISNILPCSKCRVHMVDYLTENKNGFINALESDKLSEFWDNFHNMVNIRLGKPIFPQQR